MVEVRISVSRREITLANLPRQIPPRDMRAHIHRLIDEALDGIGDAAAAGSPVAGRDPADDDGAC